MKFFRIKSFLIFIVAGLPFFLSAQDDNSIKELKQQLKRFEQRPNYLKDTAYINVLTDLAYTYSFGYPDSALLLLAGNAENCRASGYKKGETNTYIVTGDAFVSKGMYKKALDYFNKAYRLAKESNYQSVLSLILNRMGTVYINQSNYAEALGKFYESLTAAEATKDSTLIDATLNNIATVQFYQNMLSEAESTYRQTLAIAQNMHDTSSLSRAYNNLGEVNLRQKNTVKALHNFTVAYNLAAKINDREILLSSMLSMAEAYYALDSLQKSAALFNRGMKLAEQTDHGTLICNALVGLAKTYYKQGLLKEALANGLEGLQKAQQMGQVQLMRDANEIIASVYEAMNDGSNALKYYKAYKTFSDSMNNIESQRAVTIEKDKYEFSKKENEFQRQALQQRWLTFSAFAAFVLLAVILWTILRNRNRLQHTYKELQYKNTVIETEKSKAEEALVKLQATQEQLIQSEKMASLGELTAGIAHEIQNPLNFVNNFSEVNSELIDEMNDANDIEEIKAIASDIKNNNGKITHHGRRADAIVKGMLLHSRQTESIKQLTDINALCDEYLRLSYHGLRAKDKSFNADFKTDFDETIGKINIVPQDVGRVLLNLFNNAFYAVNEKKKLMANSYQPLAEVKTRSTNDKIEITVSDNGNGIPPNIINKIFQPFFTTKPTGQGTGLGLSLAYDIITKEHNGTIKVESEDGKSTAFIISLPLKA